MTVSQIPGGIGIFLYSHGVCVIVGIIYGVKYDSFRVPHSSISKAIDN